MTSLISDIDKHVRASGCNHTHQFAQVWAAQNGIDWRDMLDALEQNCMFCDCEIVANLETDQLEFIESAVAVEAANRWLSPSLKAADDSMITRWIVAKEGLGKNNYAQDGEWLIPAPWGATPRKRVRKTVHFFIGAQSGMPTEVGFVAEIEPQSTAQIVERIAASSVTELSPFDTRVVWFVQQKIARLAVSSAVGTDLREVVGVSGKRRELNIYRVIVRG
ncbi:hypothetical protein DSM3645_12126 [Blastopirellula marina DSM 3645]|uniref:Uncharacterized protein n=1 Tax=Blastopirellula marina DSM 3645 TaxID=314230 RepID=A3ZRJ5_9BACT|nr:hypothetical protein DSM3645_12126 [Blastopirellula marina DSM 3645]